MVARRISCNVMTGLQIQWRGIMCTLLLAFSLTSAQQQYNNVSGYACTGGAASGCESYAFYRIQGSQSTLASIAAVFNASAAGIANASGIDPAVTTTPLPNQTLIYVPLACSCANGTYQAITSQVVATAETMYVIANNTYEGLTTFQAIGAANPAVNATTMEVGQLLIIPLWCACPSTAQRRAGAQVLLSYPIFPGETLSLISGRFNVSVADLETANSVTDPSTLLAFSTLLIPLPALASLNSSALAPQPAPPPAPPPGIVPSPAPSVVVGESDPSKTPLYIGVGVGAAGVALALILACLLCATVARYRKSIRDKEDADQSARRSLAKPSITTDNGHTGRTTRTGFLVGMTDVVDSDKPVKFSYEELLTATNHFSDKNRIQGSVFLGKLNGSFVAIKKMKGNMSDELKILSQVHHGNVVRLVGVCASRSESLYLVYEYAENGSLSDCLHNQIAYPDSIFSRTVGLFSWKLRVQIALDVASGLEYLHNYTKPTLVHKDVKSSNILLDRQFRAKVANLGMAKSTEPGGDPMMTAHIVGTQGYMAPEYLAHGLVTTRADVFSFGVVLLELLSGRDAIFTSSNGAVHTHLSATISDVLSTGNDNNLAAWIDPRLQNAYPRDVAFSVASLAKTCVQTDPALRPDMKAISFTLSKLCQASLEWESSTRYTSGAIEAW